MNENNTLLNDEDFLDELFSDGTITKEENAPTPVADSFGYTTSEVVTDTIKGIPIPSAPPANQGNNGEVVQTSTATVEPKEEAKKSDIFYKINKLMDIYGIDKKNRFSFKNAEDVKNLLDGIVRIKENIKSLKAAFGEEAGDELLEILPDESKLLEILMSFLEARLKRIEELKNDKEALEAEEESFYQEAKENNLLSIFFLTAGISAMIEKRMANKQGNEGGNTSLIEGAVSSLKGLITEEDKENYLKNLFKKLALIEKYTGVTLDQNLVNFFKSDEFIYSGELNLPDVLRDKDFERIKNAWSLPVLIDDNREELKSREITDAETSITSLENFVVMNGLGNTKDNPTIELLNKLKGDVEEEKNRITEDNKFFTKEKLKERVECAILYGVKGQTQNPQIHSLSNALKETITGRINYMKDEQNLRNERKKEQNDKTNKDNERNSSEYQSKLSSVNKNVKERREKRAKGEIKFIPQAVTKKRTMNKENVNTAPTANYDKGKTMVLKNNWNRFNNMAS